MGDIVQPCGFCPAQRRPANHVRRGTEQHLVGFAVCRSQQAARLHNIRPVLFLLLRPRLRGIGWMPEVSAPAGGSRGMSKVPPHPAKAIFEENCFRHLPLHRGRLILPDEVTSSAGEAAGRVQAGGYRLDGCQASWRIQFPMFLHWAQGITAGMVVQTIFSENRLNRMRSKLSRAPGKRHVHRLRQRPDHELSRAPGKRRNGMYLRKM